MRNTNQSGVQPLPMLQIGSSAQSHHRAVVARSFDHTVYVYDEIEGPETLVDIVEALDTAGPNDVFHIHIATPGGSLDGAIVLIHAMMRTPAHIITYADGEVESAGTMIFLAGSEFVISPYSHFMFHDATYGVCQKVNEQRKRLIATEELLRDICTNLYSLVFSTEEIEEILNGDDKYFTSQEMIERLNAGLERLAAEAEAQQDNPEPEDQRQLLVEGND